MFVKLITDQIVTKFGESGLEGNLKQFPGTSDYYQQLYNNLATMEEHIGPPSHLVTTSMNSQSLECLVTWVSHTQGTTEQPVEVWEQEDEKRRLTLRPGAVEPDGQHQQEWGFSYFSHTGGPGGEARDNCVYHPDCYRQPIEDWRAR